MLLQTGCVEIHGLVEGQELTSGCRASKLTVQRKNPFGCHRNC
jgi:hypothetical protein